MIRRSIGLTSTIVALGLLCFGCQGSGGGKGNVNNGTTNIVPDTTSQMTHQWTFNGNVNDSVGTLDGTIQGSPTYVNSLSEAISFDGTSGVTLPDTTDMELQGPFTISAWVKVTAYPTTSAFGMFIFRGDDRSGVDPFFIGVESSKQLNFTVQNLTQSNTLHTSCPLNQTMLITAVNDPINGKMYLYKNGQIVDSTWITILPLTTLDSTQHPGIGIGCNNDYPNSSFNYAMKGVIDDMRVYTRAMNSVDVAELYNQGPQ